MYWTYILQDTKSNKKYIGYTKNLKKRLEEHKKGHGGKTTSKYKDSKLIYCEGYLNKKDALGREKFLKSGAGWKHIDKQLKNYLNNL